MENDKSSRFNVEVEYSDYEVEQVKDGYLNLWPPIRIYIENLESPFEELCIHFDGSMTTFLNKQLEALIFAISGGRTAVCEKSSIRLDGERYNTSSVNCWSYYFSDELVFSISLINPKNKIHQKTVLSEEDYEVVPPINEIPLDESKLLWGLIAAGHDHISFIEENASDEVDFSRLRALLRDAEIAYEYYETHGSFAEFSYDTSLENFETLFFEGDSLSPYVLGPIRDKWLERYALKHNVIEKLVNRIRTRPPDVANRQYKSLLMMEYDEVTKRTLQILRKEPDQKAIPALLLFVWGDNPQIGPDAVRIIGNALAENKELVISRDWENVLQQLENRPEQSDHPEIRIAAIESLGEIGEERSRPVIEAARDDPDADVRSTAERVLETL